MTNLGIWFWGS